MRVMGADIKSVVCLGSDTKEYQGKLSVKLNVLQGSEVLPITVPESLWAVVDSIGVGQLCDITVNFGSFYNKNDDKVIVYVKLADIKGIVQE